MCHSDDLTDQGDLQKTSIFNETATIPRGCGNKSSSVVVRVYANVSCGHIMNRVLSCGSNSVVECLLAKEDVESSNLFSRSIFLATAFPAVAIFLFLNERLLEMNGLYQPVTEFSAKPLPDVYFLLRSCRKTVFNVRENAHYMVGVVCVGARTLAGRDAVQEMLAF